jgi:hypothetical protein
VAFYANTTIGAGIFFAWEAIGLTALARQCHPAYEWPGGGQFGALGNSLVLNDNGHVAFRAVRSGTGTQPNGLFLARTRCTQGTAWRRRPIPAKWRSMSPTPVMPTTSRKS